MTYDRGTAFYHRPWLGKNITTSPENRCRLPRITAADWVEIAMKGICEGSLTSGVELEARSSPPSGTHALLPQSQRRSERASRLLYGLAPAAESTAPHGLPTCNLAVAITASQ